MLLAFHVSRFLIKEAMGAVTKRPTWLADMELKAKEMVQSSEQLIAQTRMLAEQTNGVIAASKRSVAELNALSRKGAFNYRLKRKTNRLKRRK